MQPGEDQEDSASSPAIDSTGGISPLAALEMRRASNIAAIEASQRLSAAESYRTSVNRDLKFRGEALEKELQNSHPLAAVIRKAEVKEEKAQRDAQRKEESRELQTSVIRQMVSEASKVVWMLSALQAAEDAERRLIERDECKVFSGGYYKAASIPRDRQGEAEEVVPEISRFNDPDLKLGVDHDDHPFRILSAVSSLPSEADHLSTLCPPNTILGQLQRQLQSAARAEMLKSQRQILATAIDEFVQRKVESGDALPTRATATEEMAASLSNFSPSSGGGRQQVSDALPSSFMLAASNSVNKADMSYLLAGHPKQSDGTKITNQLASDRPRMGGLSLKGDISMMMMESDFILGGSTGPPRGNDIDTASLCSIRKPPLVAAEVKDRFGSPAVVKASAPQAMIGASLPPSPAGAAASILSAYTPFGISDGSFMAKSHRNQPMYNQSQSVLTFGEPSSPSLLRSNAALGVGFPTENTSAQRVRVDTNSGPSPLPHFIEHGGTHYQCLPMPLDPSRISQGANRTNASGLDVKGGMEAAYDQLAMELMRVEGASQNRGGAGGTNSRGQAYKTQLAYSGSYNRSSSSSGHTTGSYTRAAASLSGSGGNSGRVSTRGPPGTGSKSAGICRVIPTASNLPIRRSGGGEASTTAKGPSQADLQRNSSTRGLSRFATDTVRGLINNHGIPPLAPQTGNNNSTTSAGASASISTAKSESLATPTEAKSRLTSAPAAFVGRMRPSAFDTLHNTNGASLSFSGSTRPGGANASKDAYRGSSPAKSTCISGEYDHNHQRVVGGRPSSVPEYGSQRRPSELKTQSDPKPIPTAALFSSPKYQPSAAATLAALASASLKSPLAPPPQQGVEQGGEPSGSRKGSAAVASGASDSNEAVVKPLSIAMLNAGRAFSPPSATTKLMLHFASTKPVTHNVNAKQQSDNFIHTNAAHFRQQQQHGPPLRTTSQLTLMSAKGPVVSNGKIGNSRGTGIAHGQLQPAPVAQPGGPVDLAKVTLDAELRRARLLSGNRVKPAMETGKETAV